MIQSTNTKQKRLEGIGIVLPTNFLISASYLAILEQQVRDQLNPPGKHYALAVPVHCTAGSLELWANKIFEERTHGYTVIPIDHRFNANSRSSLKSYLQTVADSTAELRKDGGRVQIYGPELLLPWAESTARKIFTTIKPVSCKSSPLDVLVKPNMLLAKLADKYCRTEKKS